jgi:hypothetical protein
MTVTTRPPRVAPTIDVPAVPLHAPAAGDLRVGRAKGLPLRREGPDKLTGTALYTDDLVFPGAWFGHTVRSTEAHARLLGIDLDSDFDWSAVVVLTAKDIPGENLVSLITDDQPALVETEIRHYAEPVALGARSRHAAQAAQHIKLRTEPLPAVFVPSHRSRIRPFRPRQRRHRGRLPEAGSRRGTYRSATRSNCTSEQRESPCRADGGVTIHGSLRCYYIHKALKRALKLTDTQAVVIRPRPAVASAAGGTPRSSPSAARCGAARGQAGAHDLRPPRGHRGTASAPAIMPPHGRDDGRLVAQDIES